MVSKGFVQAQTVHRSEPVAPNRLACSTDAKALDPQTKRE